MSEATAKITAASPGCEFDLYPDDGEVHGSCDYSLAFAAIHCPCELVRTQERSVA
jgi:hypothetical protein